MTPITFPLRIPARLIALGTVTAILLALGASATVAKTAKPKPAPARLQVGIGQQSSQLFQSPYWYALHLPNVRYVAPWDVLSDKSQRIRFDDFMHSAIRARANVMIGLSHSLRTAKLATRLPTPAQYQRAVRALHKRYPTIREWVPWNEVNHPSALTARKPGLVATYYNIVKKACPKCLVVGGDVLDTGNMKWWITQFLRKTHNKPRIWGIHNYSDANRFKREGVVRLLRMVKGQIWFTETGGVLRYRIHVRGTNKTRNFGEAHAAKATRYVLDLSRLSKRITRVYLYNWTAPIKYTTWDSGLMTSMMRPRKSYHVLRAWLVRARRSHLVPAVPAVTRKRTARR